MADRRLDPLDEALRLWALLTQTERVRFLAAIAAPARPSERGSEPEDDGGH